jgi:hypothetical protein
MYKYTLTAQTVEPSKSLPKKTLQIELESVYAIEKENIGELKTFSTPNFLFRYGFLKNIELQFSIPIIKEIYYENHELVYSTHKFDDIQLGFSIDLWHQKKWLPEAALMTRSFFHYQSDFNFNYVGQTVSLNLLNEFTKKLSITYNFGYAFEKKADFSYFIISNLSYQLYQNLNLFIEYSGNNTSSNKFIQNFATGISYQLNKSIFLDFSIAKGLNQNLFYTGGRLTWVIENL